MSEWTTLPTVATGDLLRGSVWVDVWNNLQTLKNMEFAVSYANRSSNWTTTSTPFVSLGAYALDFESYGNPILIYVGVRFSHAAASGVGAITLYLDGTDLGGSSGLAYVEDINDTQETTGIFYVVTSLAAGNHQLRAYYRTGTASSNFEVWGSPGLPIFVLEL